MDKCYFITLYLQSECPQSEREALNQFCQLYHEQRQFSQHQEAESFHKVSYS